MQLSKGARANKLLILLSKKRNKKKERMKMEKYIMCTKE